MTNLRRFLKIILLNDLSFASTETKYVHKTKTQNNIDIFKDVFNTCMGR